MINKKDYCQLLLIGGLIGILCVYPHQGTQTIKMNWYDSKGIQSTRSQPDHTTGYYENALWKI